MSPGSSKYAYLSVISFSLALYFFIAISVSALGSSSALVKPGAFLVSRFNLASLYIPLLLMYCGFLTKANRLPKKTIILLWISPIPFLTSAIFLHIVFNNTTMLAPRVLVTAFGRFPAILLFLLLLAIEIAGIAGLSRYLEGSDHSLFTGKVLNRIVNGVISFFNSETSGSTVSSNGEQGKQVNEIFSPAFPEQPFEYHGPPLQEAPEKLAFPGSPMAEPGISDFISRVLNSKSELSADCTDSIEDSPDEYEDIPEELEPRGSEPIGPKPVPAFRHSEEQYHVPVEGLLDVYPEPRIIAIDETIRKAANVLEQTLKEFRIDAKVTGICKGPVITMFELLPSPGVKLSSIVNLQDNIALRLAASRVRIIAPIPGKHAVGIEVPNKKRSIVSFSSIVESEEFRQSNAEIPVILGKDISGGNKIIDLTRTPHLLIAGATGSGKSVCVNSLIASVLYSRGPRDVKLLMVDPKIVELKLYNGIPHLLTPVIIDTKRAIQALQWCLYEMERRYSLLDSQGVRDIKSLNIRIRERELATDSMPYILVIVDEFADLMATSGKDLEAIVARLAAMSRAVGIHLVLATQRPSVDVITGLIKANFPSRIAFMVAGKTDSRIIIDTMGAEKLLGRGDMLFTSAWDPFPSRMQGAFLAENEIEKMADYVKSLGEPDYIDHEMFIDDEDEHLLQREGDGDDPVYEKAVEIVVSSRKTSASYLQRRLKLGYNRAARLIEEMERRGIVGPANGSKPRELIHVP
ncbi:DNA translocase FtsK [Olavius algarvensis spirochete endosymbiont]|uniref:DNA translocase FtsK n=1 Tax=Olavius algarvensis spirochete endosymbiont TaxID=260710 RepID=UPI00052E32A7|nr:DNA translocase FtsK [Olavius algarvensis spirochete endosymbiont]KGM38295.1 hypothetical protein JY97_17125 [Alkalispirochaeta odontotermitis]VDA99707.1 DNA translocase FtsK [Olavius algarvensis spirochete endosymbiont]